MILYAAVNLPPKLYRRWYSREFASEIDLFEAVISWKHKMRYDTSLKRFLYVAYLNIFAIKLLVEAVISVVTTCESRYFFPLTILHFNLVFILTCIEGGSTFESWSPYCHLPVRPRFHHTIWYKKIDSQEYFLLILNRVFVISWNQWEVPCLDRNIFAYFRISF